MSINKDLNYHLYVHRIDGFQRTPFQFEMERYAAVRQGDVETVKQKFAEGRSSFYEGKGKLSDNPLHNIRYHFVVSVTMVSRVCIEGGLPQDTAYTLSDIYIQKADKCNNVDSIIDMFVEMQTDYAKRMQEIKKKSATSLHVRRCIDYIYNHLHEDLSMEVLANLVGLHPSYLTKLFFKETGMTPKDFILLSKVETAKNMLCYSDFTYLEISHSLGFCSQSSFISTFKKRTGYTPKQYRDIYGE